MSDETVRPALTPEEWADEVVSRDVGTNFEMVEHVERGRAVHMDGWVSGGDLHALAALCLHGQPFGFTREDVRLLHFVMMQFTPETDGWDDDLTSLADRIEALLPPE